MPRMSGGSMIGVGIFDGDLLIVDHEKTRAMGMVKNPIGRLRSNLPRSTKPTDHTEDGYQFWYRFK